MLLVNPGVYFHINKTTIVQHKHFSAINSQIMVLPVAHLPSNIWKPLVTRHKPEFQLRLANFHFKALELIVGVVSTGTFCSAGGLSNIYKQIFETHNL